MLEFQWINFPKNDMAFACNKALKILTLEMLGMVKNSQKLRHAITCLKRGLCLNIFKRTLPGSKVDS